MATRQTIIEQMWGAGPHLAEEDPEALAELRRRLVETGRGEELITYSELVQGIAFRLPSINGGRPFALGEDGEWSGLDRMVLGRFLGYLSAETYRDNEPGFLLSALAVLKETRQPSEPGFFGWTRQLGLLERPGEEATLTFWVEQVRLAQAWCRRQPRPAGAADARRRGRR